MRSTVPVLAVVALLLSACGGNSAAFTATGEATKSVVQIISDAKNAVRSATSVHYADSYVEKGQTYTSDITQAGPNLSAGYYTSATGNRVTFIRSGQSTYLRSDAWFWKGYPKSRGAVLAKLTAGKWLKLTPFFARAFKIPSPSHRLGEILKGAGSLRNDGDTRNERRVLITLANVHSKLYLVPSFPDYPVAFVDNTPDGAHFAFDHWNAPLSVTVPKHAINLANLVP